MRSFPETDIDPFSQDGFVKITTTSSFCWSTFFILSLQNRGRFGLKRAGTKVRRLILAYVNLSLKNGEFNFCRLDSGAYIN